MTTTCPAHSTAPACALRVVQVSCRCLDHLEHNEPAPRAPLALAIYQSDKTEADALDHVAKAICYRNFLEVQLETWADDPNSSAKTGAELDAAVQAAYRRQHALEKVAAQRWGVCVVVDHDF